MTSTPRRTTRNKVLLFGCLGLGVVGLAIVAIVGWAVVAELMEGSPAPSQGAGDRGALTCQMEEPCDVGPGVITITKVTKEDVLRGPTGRSRGNWVVVRFNYTYEGQEPGQALDGYEAWRLVDGQGRSYSYDIPTTTEFDIAWTQDRIYLNRINPGVSYETLIIFEVSPDATDFTLEVEDLVSPRKGQRAEILGV